MTHVETQKDNEEKKVKQYYHNKQLGSEQFVTDWKGRQYEHIEYTPYGELWTYKSKTAMLFLTTYNNFLAKQPAGLIEETAPGVDKLPLRFTGKELDTETGLYYYGARYLDPKYSRFMSCDHIIFGLNIYIYGGNNPITYNDPTGLFQEDSRYSGIVEKDDTLAKITTDHNKKYGTNYSYDDVAQSSDIEDPNKIEPGQKIIFPDEPAMESRQSWGAQDARIGEMESIGDVFNITIHSTDSNKTPAQIQQKHMGKWWGQNNWPDIGYHFLIGQDGTIYKGVDLQYKGIHVLNSNTGRIGIALMGDFQPGWLDNNSPTDIQIEALIDLILFLKAHYDIKSLGGHRDYKSSTLCPGDNVYPLLPNIRRRTGINGK